MLHAIRNSITGVCIMIGLFSSANAEKSIAKDVYGFTFTQLIGGDPLPLEQFKGKAMLIVNTASECGLTGQYEGLEALHDRFSEQGLVVLGVPSNDFGGQEPGTEQEIAKFCELNYGVSFPMAAKETVKGDDAHPFYNHAREKLGWGTAPKWNFHKYLVNRDGELIDHFNSTTSPEASHLVEAIETVLAAN